MELFFFDKSFLSCMPKAELAKYQGLLQSTDIPDGRPFFLNSHGLPDPELDGFCQYLLAPSRPSSKTWLSYATQVHVFLRFMEAQGKNWKQAQKADLEAYYQTRVLGKHQNGKAIKTQSWNIAKTAIVHLYEYGLESGLIAQMPFRYRKSRAHFGGKQMETADLNAKVTPEPINFISITNYQSLWRPIVADNPNSQRNLTLIDLLITTGLRISEALGLLTHHIPDPDNQIYQARKTIPIRIIGKGNKYRIVKIPKQIVRAIRFYIDEERELAIDNFKTAHPILEAPSAVFLSRNGNPLSKRTVQTFFTSVSQKTEIKLTPHGCRHTFAIYQLEAMIRKMAANLKLLRETGADAYRQIMQDPLRQLQRLLGHTGISTTFIYLDFLEEAEALVEDSLDSWTNWESLGFTP